MPKRVVVQGVNDLESARPDVASEWHVEKNYPLKPNQITYGSKKKIWWRCNQSPNHEWEATINSRTTNNSGCPVCSGQKVVPGINDLATTHPELADLWDPILNVDLKPSQVSRGSGAVAWWRCPNQPKHSFQMNVVNRVRGENCGVCSGRRFQVGVNDLRTTHPELALEWHPSKNLPLTVQDVGKSFPKIVWWRCSLNSEHEFQASPKTRVYMKTKCSICTGHQVQRGINDLATTHPELAEAWDVERNTVAMNSVGFGSHKKVWWICEKNPAHRWQASANNRLRSTGTTGCPVCLGKIVLAGVNDLATTHPDIAQYWIYDKNLGADPTSLSWGSSARKFWWRCEKDSRHEYRSTVVNRMTRGCPVCDGKQVMPGLNDLATLRPDIAAQWHPTKNKGLKPAMFTESSSRAKIWWQCSTDSSHVWLARISSRTHTGTGCPTCADSGYDATRPGTFYLIAHTGLKARKVGITNPDRGQNRIENWKKRQWKVIQTIHSEDGSRILNLETQVLRWIRKDLGLPPFLGSQDIGNIGGASETFSAEGPSDSEVWAKVTQIFATLDPNPLDPPEE